MATHSSTNNAGGWVRLVYLTTSIALDRWPGPHGPGTVIHTSGAGLFVFDHHDHNADGGPEAVYLWTPTT